MPRQKKLTGQGDCLCFCGVEFDQNKIKCQDHLKNWDLWKKRRQRVHKKLEKLGREPGKLLMNIAEEYRSVVEDKLVLGYRKIETKFDKYRGNPTFWNFPASLKNKSPPFSSSEYFAIKTNEEKYEIPPIEYVGVPDYIFQEKNVLPRTRNLYKLWRCKNLYRKQVAERASSKIQSIEPHKPDIHDLIIIGQQIEGEGTKEKNKLIDKAGDDEMEKSFSENTTVLSSVALSPKKTSFKINKIEFYEEDPLILHKNITVIFEKFADSLEPSEQTIIFENTGCTVIRIFWNRYKKLKLFREFDNCCTSFHPFVFATNELLLLPGQKISFPIWFQVNRPGNFFESWKISTLPKIWNVENQLLIVLKGFAFIKKFEENVDQIRNMLVEREKDTLIKDLLSEIITKGNYCKVESCVSFDFTEKELFEGANLENNVSISKPRYTYNKSLVAKLKTFYKTVKQNKDPEIWDLSIKTLKKVARQKDLLQYCESKSVAYNLVKTKRIPPCEVQNKEDNKNEKVLPSKTGNNVKSNKDISTSAVDDNLQNKSYYSELKGITQQLEKPSVIDNTERNKYFWTYLVVNTYITKLFSECNTLNGNSILEQTIPEYNYTGNSLYIRGCQERTIFERFDEGYISRTKRIPPEVPGSCKAQPKSTLLKGVSTTDARKVFKLYFNKEQIKDKAQKKHNPDKTEEKLSKREGNKSRITENDKKKQIQENLYQENIENFDPFLQEVSSESVNSNILPTDHLAHKTTIKHKQDIQDYEEKYLVVYLNLSELVDTVIDIVDNSKDRFVASSILGELQNVKIVDINDIQKETKNYKSSTSQESPLTPSLNDEEYFNILLTTHWKQNLKTQKYIIKENQYFLSGTQSRHSEKSEIDYLSEPLTNVFSVETFQRKPIPYGLKEVQNQTSFENLDIHDTTNASLDATSNNTTNNDEIEKHHNLFYFLNDICNEEK